MLPHALLFQPQYRDYIWGGRRLRPGQLTAEAWIVHENDQIAAGPLAGKTLAQITEEFGPDLLGKRVIDRRGPRFPLLIKLLDCNQWLSLQVHPNDRQAVELEGPGQNGKTEAWYILDAAPDAKIIAGLKAGTTADAMAQATHAGTIIDMSNFVNVKKDDTVFMRSGTIHALGPGLLVYEVQQSSDITYRVFDWNRPQTNGRVLHIDKSLAVANPAAGSQAIPTPPLQDGGCQVLCQSEYFTLEIVNAHENSIEMDTHGESFHILTVIEGEAEFTSGDDRISLHQFETLLVPSAAGSYRLVPKGGFRLLKAFV